MFDIKRWFLKFKTNSLCDSLKVINIITIFNGLLPYRLRKNDGKTVQMWKPAIFTASLHYIFYIVCTIWTCEENARIRETFFQSEVSNFVAFTYGTLTLVTFTSIFGLSFLLRKNLLKMMQILVKIDDIFKDLSLKPNCQQITNLTIYVSILLLTFKVAYNTVAFFVYKAAAPSFSLQIVFNLPYTFIWTYIIVYVTFVFIIKFCMRHINRVRCPLCLFTTISNSYIP